jgi:hypothetical protein
MTALLGARFCDPGYLYFQEVDPSATPWERVAPAAPRRRLHQRGGAVAKVTKGAKTSRCERKGPETAFLLRIKKLYQRCFYIVGVLQI